MRDWLCKILCRNKSTERENNGTYTEWDIEARVRDLRRRIEEQKRAVGYYTPQSSVVRSNEKILESPPQRNIESTTKNTELNDLKAKLLGKKK